MKECYKRQRHYIMIKGSIQKEDLTIINIYAPNREAPQHVKQILTNIKEEIDSNTIIMADFDTPLSSKDRSSTQKINKEMQAFSDTLDELDLIFLEHSMQKQQSTHFSQVHAEHSPGLTTYRAIRLAVVNLRKSKSYKGYFLITML